MTNFGADTSKRMSTPAALRLTSSESSVVAVASYGTSMIGMRPAMPSFSPAVVVVLIEDADLSAGVMLQQIVRVNARLALVARLPTHRPGEAIRVVPFAGAAGDEQLRHLFAVHVFLDRGVGRRSQAVEDEQDLVALDEFPGLLHGLGRVVAVVIGNEADLAAVDAALGIDLVEIGGFGLADDPVGRGQPAIRNDVADADLGITGTRVVALLRERGIRQYQSERNCGRQSPAVAPHLLPSRRTVVTTGSAAANPARGLFFIDFSLNPTFAVRWNCLGGTNHTSAVFSKAFSGWRYFGGDPEFGAPLSTTETKSSRGPFKVLP